MPLLTLLLLLPLIEIAGFVWLGPMLGVAGTVAVVVLSTFAGMALLRHEGIGLLIRLRAGLVAGETPVPAALDGACRIVAAMLLIVPGFFSTAAGLILLLPPLRGLIVRHFGGRLHQAAPGLWTTRARRTVIDAEFVDVGRPHTDLPPR